MHFLSVTTLELSRWQFASTTIYHFLFAPVTIGLSTFVAGLQTAWYRTRDPNYLRLTHFFGKLLLINVALGVVTGLVLEFQFGMNWSSFSRVVGDVFGTPLAIEGLVAFFLEAVLLGLWIFGWERIKPRLHLALIWAVAAGSILSAYFILAANVWMQHPVGYEKVAGTGRVRMTSLWEIMTQPRVFLAVGHVVLAAGSTAGVLILAVSAYHLLRGNDSAVFLRNTQVTLLVLFLAAGGSVLTGHFLGQIMGRQQPMKAAASEAQYDTTAPASLSLFAWFPWEDNPKKDDVFQIQVPHGLSLLSDNSWSAEVEGINETQREYEREYGPGNYEPMTPVVYWSFRLMVGIAFFLSLFALFGLYLWRRGRLAASRRFLLFSMLVLPLPFLANTFGWILAEMGRQPWVVQGLLLTADAVSPSVSTRSVALTLATFSGIYALLAVAEAWIMSRAAMKGPEKSVSEPGEESQLPVMSY